MPPTYFIEGVTIAAYLLLIVTVGFTFNRCNGSTDDYFRSGRRGTRWLVGIIVTVWVPLQAIPLCMGPLVFARSPHHMAFGRNLEISDERETSKQKPLQEAQAAYRKYAR